MSDKKKTFIDPKTAMEIESTPLARLVLGLMIPILVFICDYLLYVFNKLELLNYLIPICCLNLIMIWKADNRNTMIKYQRVIHDYIARAQHFRRQRFFQRKLAEKEWAGVPSTALTRVDPSKPPQATGASLSLVGKSNESEDGGRIRLTGEQTTDLKESVAV